MSDVVGSDMTAEQARSLTDEVRADAERLYEKLLRLHNGRAWRALGYDSWDVFIQAEFDMSKRRANQLVAHARVVQAVEVGTVVPTSTADDRPGTTVPASETADRQTFLAPTSERQTRSLARLLPAPNAEPKERTAAEQRVRDTWQKAASTAPRGTDGRPKITADHVERTVAEAQEGAVRDALDDYVSADPAVQNSMYIHKFMSAFQSGGKWLAFDVERVANLIDETDLILLGYHVESVGRFVEAVRRSRRGLRVINGGSK